MASARDFDSQLEEAFYHGGQKPSDAVREWVLEILRGVSPSFRRMGDWERECLTLQISDSDIPKSVKTAMGYLDYRKVGDIINGLSHKIMAVQHDRWHADKFIIYSPVTGEINAYLSRHPELRKGWN